jgi:anti-sigma B factor antagonist
MTVEKQRFKVTRSPDENVVHLVVEGELDLASAPVLLEYLQDATSAGFCEDISMDVSRLSFIDSAGLFSLVIMQKRAAENGTKFTLCSPSEPFLKLLDVSGLRRFFDLVTFS